MSLNYGNCNPVANHAANLVKLHGKWYFIDAQNGEFLQGWDKAPEWWKLNPSKFEKTYKVKVSDKSYDLLKDEYFDEKGRLFLDSDYDRESPSLALNDL